MTATILIDSGPIAPSRELAVDRTLGAHVGALRQYIVEALASEGCALDANALDALSESVLAEAVRLAVHWVEEAR